MNKEEQSRRGEDVIAGRNAVTEALRSGRPIDSLYVSTRRAYGEHRRIDCQSKEAGHSRQGGGCQKAGLFVRERRTSRAWWRWPPRIRMPLWTISSPWPRSAASRRFLSWRMNWRTRTTSGPFLRSPAECAGAHGVIIPKRRSVGLHCSAVGYKASAGAVEYVPVVRVTRYRLHFGGTRGGAGFGPTPRIWTGRTGARWITKGRPRW